MNLQRRLSTTEEKVSLLSQISLFFICFLFQDESTKAAVHSSEEGKIVLILFLYFPSELIRSSQKRM